ncbi:hypothetical protein E4U38_001324 [Claviceps purpurea]|nr:hypothetical protein E4U38_001324 [Claviceps purpurea]
MVQIKSLMVAMIVAIAPVAQAWNCTPGRRYCGWNLSRFNYDEGKITEALERSGWPSEKKDKTLFVCNPDGSMKIQPATIGAYLSALRSVHVDLKLPTTDFDDDRWAPAIGLATLASALHLIRISFNRLPILIIVEETRPLPKANLRSTTISTTRDHAL